jgi:hypothetical protein
MSVSDQNIDLLIPPLPKAILGLAAELFTILGENDTLLFAYG